LRKREQDTLIEEWSDEDVARAYGWMRVIVGLGLFLFPRLATRTWTGEDGEDAVTNLAVRGMGARDMAIGAGVVTALERGTPVRGWLEAGAMVDAGDALGTLFSWRGLGKPRGVFWFLTEVGGAAFGLALAERID